MQVKILKKYRGAPGFVGDTIEINAAEGNRLAGLGCVQIIQHDQPEPAPAAPPRIRTYKPKPAATAGTLAAPAAPQAEPDEPQSEPPEQPKPTVKKKPRAK